MKYSSCLLVALVLRGVVFAAVFATPLALAQLEPLPRGPLSPSIGTPSQPTTPTIGRPTPTMPTPSAGPRVSLVNAARIGPLFANRRAVFDLEVSGLPDDSYAEMRINPRTYADRSVRELVAISGFAEGSRVRNGTILRQFQVIAENSQVTNRGLILNIEVEVRPSVAAANQARFFHIRTPAIPMTRLKTVTEVRTSKLTSVFDLNLRRDLIALPGSDGGRWTEDCRGRVGNFTTGIITRGDKLAFRAHTGLRGARCLWEGKASAPFPVKVIAMTWSNRTQGSACRKPDAPKRLPAISVGQYLRTDWVDVGDGRQVMANLRRLHDDNQTPRMQVRLICDGRPVSDDFVEVTFESVELEIPENWSLDSFVWSRSAFNPE